MPAAWARARVDALLEKIDREGEDKASIDEIIRLSRKYHFVTPYTSFLAAPRALLRPRLIRPGDPLLRVRTDPSICSVIALFPFGLTKPLRYLKTDDIWQTRFLAPDDLADGTHVVRLILRDDAGHVYREQKTFVISSQPPVLRVRLDEGRVHAGERVTLHVQASQTTRTITAQLYGAEPLRLRWNEADKSNTGVLAIPPNLPAGRYSIHVTAEDIAHNVSQRRRQLRSFRKLLLFAAVVTGGVFALRAELPSLDTSIARNTVGGSAIEAALYRVMNVPGGPVLHSRPPSESRMHLAKLISQSPHEGELYSLRAREDERALEITAAEDDWKRAAEASANKVAAIQELADFYHRRVEPDKEVGVLLQLGAVPQQTGEQFQPDPQQAQWSAFRRCIDVANESLLPSAEREQIYEASDSKISEKR